MNNNLSIFIRGKKEHLETLLFECAFHYAIEFGSNIWFISPEPFTHLPSNVKAPNREALKLITFLYLQNQKDLLNHLNGVHTWHKFPKCIILNRLEHYLESSKCSLTNAAFIVASLLDAVRACANKSIPKRAYTLVSCDIALDKLDNLKIISELYFTKSFLCEDDTNHTIQIIKDCIKV